MSEKITNWDKPAQDALNRMRDAAEGNHGCYLTRGMIQNLSLTFIGSLWSEPRPSDICESCKHPAHAEQCRWSHYGVGCACGYEPRHGVDD